MNLKLKVSAVYITTRAGFIPETKPDKRFTSGQRPTGNQISKTFINLQLDIQRDARLRVSEIFMIPNMDLQFQVTSFSIDTFRATCVKLIMSDTFSLSIDSKEYIDILPIGYSIGEKS